MFGFHSATFVFVGDDDDAIGRAAWFDAHHDVSGVALHLAGARSDGGFRRHSKLHGENIARSRVGSLGQHPF